MVIMLVVTGALLALVDPARGTFQAQPEIADMHQRLRVAVDTLAGDLLRAGAGVAPTMAPPVLPYRIGASGADPGAAVFYRPDVVSAVFVPWTDTAVISRTYSLRRDPATGTPQLMRYDGAAADLPVVDHVVGLGFEYFDDAAPIDPAVLQDGPWVSGDAVPPFDADLLRVRRVRATLRIEAALSSMRGPAGALFARGGTSTSSARYAPDLEVRFDIALRNEHAGR
jgi:hypothetical protein